MKRRFGSGRARARRQRLIQEAFDAHGSRLLRYVARLAGEEAARDIVQQTFLKLWEVDPPPDPDHLAPWLYTVCRRAAIDLHRKESRMNAHQAQLRAVPPPVAVATERKVEARRLIDRLDALPEAQREVLRLRFQGGLAYREIAEVTGRTVGSVSGLMHAGIRALRASLEVNP